MAIRNQDFVSYIRLVLGLYVLKILQHGSAHGNKLAEEIKRRTKQEFIPNTNAFYPLLRTMEEKGYIVGEWASADTRSKRIYTITPAGLERIPGLESMLAERLAQMEGRIAILRGNLLGQ